MSLRTMSNFSSTNKCPECYGNELRYWKDEPINPELVAYRDSYISPVKIYYADLNEALKAWGEEITPEEAADMFNDCIDDILHLSMI